MRIKLFVIAAALVATSGAAFAQSTAKEQRCQALAKDVEDTYKKAVMARVPKTDPGTAVQESQDVKGILSTDAAGGLSKLMNLDFSGIMNKLIQKGVDAAMQKGSSTFNNKVNGVLSDAGIKGVNFQGNTAGQALSSMAPNVNAGSLAAGVSNAVNGKAAAAATSIYGRK